MLRIIAGGYKGRTIPTQHLGDARPCLGRVRETVFNWLGQSLNGLNCLDGFAGSGSLGLEALSRGAAHCVFVDNAPAQLRELHKLCGKWNIESERYTLWEKTMPSALTCSAHPFDVVFLDAPFADTASLTESLHKLVNGQHPAPNARIYLQYPL